MIWKISSKQGSDREYLGFCAALDIGKKLDLSTLAKSLPEVTVICTPTMILGCKHLDRVMTQALDCWQRGLVFAKKRSIDLLMRLTCQSQIDEATTASGIRNASSIAAFGLAPSEPEINSTIKFVQNSIGERAVRNDKLLDPNTTKIQYYLSSFDPTLPPEVASESNILALLIERASLLLVSK